MHIFFALISCVTTILGASFFSKVETAKEEIRVMSVSPTPESNTVMLRLAIPKPGDVVKNGTTWTQFRIDGYALGASSSQFARASELSNSTFGQTVRVIVDNESPFAIGNEYALNPFNEEGYFYTTSYKFKLPMKLKEGRHILRLFPARSFGESLKGDNTFQVVAFYIGENNSQGDQMDLNQPFLTFNEPGSDIELSANRPVLLDFLVTNCELSADGYKVRLAIDGVANRTITSYQPYYIYGLKPGKHTIRLELLNGTAKVPGIFNDVERTIQVR